jgi:hypothetical protein
MAVLHKLRRVIRVGPVAAVKSGFRGYRAFNGRASRSEYGWWLLFVIVLWGSFGNVGVLVLIALGIPTIAVGMRRVRDAGLPLWFIFLPVAGQVIPLFAPTRVDTASASPQHGADLPGRPKAEQSKKSHQPTAKIPSPDALQSMLGSEPLDASDLLSDQLDSLVRLTRSGEKKFLSNFAAPKTDASLGWYVDPTGYFDERFWFGSGWSSAVRLVGGPPVLWRYASPPSDQALELIKSKTLIAPPSAPPEAPATSTWREAAARLLPSSAADHESLEPLKTGRDLLRSAWAVYSTDSDPVETRVLLDVSAAAFSEAAVTGSLEAQMWAGIVTVLREGWSSQGREMLDGASRAFEKRGNFKLAGRAAEELAEGARLASDQTLSQEHFRRAADLFERAGESRRATQARLNSAPGRVRTRNPLFSGGQPSLTATTILGSEEALALSGCTFDGGKH